MMDTSKTSSIKSLLLRAWRERWTDLQWGIYIKQVLPRGVSGDVYNLADCILLQALIGPGPNILVLSYLRHSLSSKVVSYGAVLQSISKYQMFHKPHCILSLLELLKGIQNRISCHGNADECLVLCVSMVSCMFWLYSCILQSLQKLQTVKQSPELKQSPEHSSIIDKACELLKTFSETTFVKALLYIGKHEDQNVYNQVVQKCAEIETQLSQMQGSNVPKEGIEFAIKIIHSIDSVTDLSPSSCPSQMLLSSLNGILALDAILNPTSDMQSLVDQLLLLQKMQNISWPVLYCEMVRACFMGLIDSSGGTEDLKWPSFTFLKLPQVIVKIHNILRGNISEPSADLEEGLQLLLGYTPLLDLADTKCNCDCLQFLLNELLKTTLISETQFKKLLKQRQDESQKVTVRSPEQQKAQPGNPDLILRAEPTVASILKTLDADYSKNQDALLGVLCHMMSGKSFELILAAAAATGKLQSFAVKLIKFNEFSKQIIGEGSKASQTRALLFDITFLMLCHIAQQYGAEVCKEIVSSNGETKDSFFEQWMSESLAEGGKYKSPDLMLQHADSSIVDFFLSQISSSDGNLKTNLVKWHEICINAPAAIKEILVAWEYGCVSIESVRVILDNVKGRMCCLPVCISAWLCSYINIIHHDHRIKPLSILQEFQKPLNVDQNNPESTLSQVTQDSSNLYYKERAGLMIAIIKRMFYDVHPPNVNPSKMKLMLHQNILVSKTPISEILETEFNAVHMQGWLDLKTTHTLENLLSVGGPQWFCSSLVKLGMNFVHNAELQRSVELLFAIFQLDIEACTIALLIYTLPSYLQNLNRLETLTEPSASALARLSVMCIYSALQTKSSQKVAASMKKRAGKRSRRETETEGLEGGEMGRPTKYRRMLGDVDMLELDDIGMLQGGGSSQSSLNLADPLNKGIDGLFRLFGVIASDPTISQRTHFLFLFLNQAVLCGKERARTMLQFMPLSLVSKILKCLPDLFSTELVLALCDTQTSLGRKAMAKMLCQLHNYNAQRWDIKLE